MTTVSVVESDCVTSLRTCGSGVISAFSLARRRSQGEVRPRTESGYRTRCGSLRDGSLSPHVAGLGEALVASPLLSVDSRPLLSPYSRCATHNTVTKSPDDLTDDFSEDELDPRLWRESRDTPDPLVVVGSRPLHPSWHRLDKQPDCVPAFAEDMLCGSEVMTSREGTSSPGNPPPSPVNFNPSLEGFVVGGQKLTCPSRSTDSTCRDFTPGYVKKMNYECIKCEGKMLDTDQTQLSLNRRMSRVLQRRISHHVRSEHDDVRRQERAAAVCSHDPRGRVSIAETYAIQPDGDVTSHRSMSEMYACKLQERREREREMSRQRERRRAQLQHVEMTRLLEKIRLKEKRSRVAMLQRVGRRRTDNVECRRDFRQESSAEVVYAEYTDKLESMRKSQQGSVTADTQLMNITSLTGETPSQTLPSSKVAGVIDNHGGLLTTRDRRLLTGGDDLTDAVTITAISKTHEARCCHGATWPYACCQYPHKVESESRDNVHNVQLSVTNSSVSPKCADRKSSTESKMDASLPDIHPQHGQNRSSEPDTASHTADDNHTDIELSLPEVTCTLLHDNEEHRLNIPNSENLDDKQERRCASCKYDDLSKFVTSSSSVLVPHRDVSCSQWVSFSADSEPVLNTAPAVQDGCDTFLKRLQRTKLADDACLPSGHHFCFEAMVDKRYNRWKRRRRKKNAESRRSHVTLANSDSSDDEDRTSAVERILDSMYEQIHGPVPQTPNGSRETPRMRNRRRRKDPIQEETIYDNEEEWNSVRYDASDELTAISEVKLTSTSSIDDVTPSVTIRSNHDHHDNMICASPEEDVGVLESDSRETLDQSGRVYSWQDFEAYKDDIIDLISPVQTEKQTDLKADENQVVPEDREASSCTQTWPATETGHVEASSRRQHENVDQNISSANHNIPDVLYTSRDSQVLGDTSTNETNRNKTPLSHLNHVELVGDDSDDEMCSRYADMFMTKVESNQQQFEMKEQNDEVPDAYVKNDVIKCDSVTSDGYNVEECDVGVPVVRISASPRVTPTPLRVTSPDVMSPEDTYQPVVFPTKISPTTPQQTYNIWSRREKTNPRPIKTGRAGSVSARGSTVLWKEVTLSRDITQDEVLVGPAQRHKDVMSGATGGLNKGRQEVYATRKQTISLPVLGKNSQGQTVPTSRPADTSTQTDNKKPKQNVKKKEARPKTQCSTSDVKPNTNTRRASDVTRNSEVISGENEGEKRHQTVPEFIFRDYYLRSLYEHKLRLNQEGLPRLRKTKTVDELDVGRKSPRQDGDRESAPSPLAFTRAFTFSMFDLPNIYKNYNQTLEKRAYSSRGHE